MPNDEKMMLVYIGAMCLLVGTVYFYLKNVEMERDDLSDDDDTTDIEKRQFIQHMRSGNLFPRGALKETSERHRKQYGVSIYNPGSAYDIDYTYHGYDTADDISPILYPKKRLPSHGHFNNGITSIDPHEYSIPRARVYNPSWEKVGIARTENSSDDALLNVYRRPISQGMDLWQYKVQDKHGFEITLQKNDYIEDGDNIGVIRGKESKGSWIVNLDSVNKWVYF